MTQKTSFKYWRRKTGWLRRESFTRNYPMAFMIIPAGVRCSLNFWSGLFLLTVNLNSFLGLPNALGVRRYTLNHFPFQYRISCSPVGKFFGSLYKMHKNRLWVFH